MGGGLNEKKQQGASVSISDPIESRIEGSAEFTFTIPNGADGSLVDPIDLGACYQVITITCEDGTGVVALSTAGAWVDRSAAGTLCELCEENDPGTPWAGTMPTGAGESADFVLTHAYGIRRIRFILSLAAAGADVVLIVKGHGRIA